MEYPTCFDEEDLTPILKRRAEIASESVLEYARKEGLSDSEICALHVMAVDPVGVPYDRRLQRAQRESGCTQKEAFHLFNRWATYARCVLDRSTVPVGDV